MDLHCVFPNPKADPDDPANYRFGLTDAYFKSILDTGAEIYLRLGESIEHGPHKVYIRPELWTPEQLARVCVNIVRHYNDGWADGHRWGIKHVEFWNEPENRWDQEPDRRICWTGSAAQFVDFYVVVAKALKAHDAALAVGLAGFTVRFTRAWLATSAADMDSLGGWTGVVAACAKAGAPIDFVSWHFYGETWRELCDLSRGVRRRLDALGLPNAENHLTEWHYVPQMQDERGTFTFTQVRLTSDYDRIERALAATTGPRAAAFTFGALARLQDAQLDLAHHYTGIAGNWGLFAFSGRPNNLYDAFVAFQEFINDGNVQRVRAVLDEGVDPEALAVLAAAGKGRLKLGIARMSEAPSDITVRINETNLDGTKIEARRLLHGGWERIETDMASDVITVSFEEAGLVVIDLVTSEA